MLATRGHLDLSSWLQPARLWRHRAVSQAAVAAVAAAALAETARGGRVVGISAGSSAFCCQAWSATLVPTVCGHPSVPWPSSLHLGHCTSCSCHVQLLTLRPDVREGETDLPPHSARHVFGERVKQLFFFFFSSAWLSIPPFLKTACITFSKGLPLSGQNRRVRPPPHPGPHVVPLCAVGRLLELCRSPSRSLPFLPREHTAGQMARRPQDCSA